MRSVLLTTFVLAVLASQSGSAQEPRADFSSESRVVVLHVAVKDRKGGYVGGLNQGAFKISEDKQPQAISFFHNQDAPVTIGLLIDSSGSMSPNRELVIAASVAFAEAMNPDDEMFVLGFNENLHTPLPKDAPFTRDVPTLRRALADAIKARGQSAVYNAVNAGLGYVTKGSFERQVLVIVSDGGDNASATTKAEVIANAQASNAVVYTVALVDPMDSEADPGFLTQLAHATGGEAFRPKNIGEVDSVLQRISLDIRNMYTLGYVPSNSLSLKKEELRRVVVDVRLPTGQKVGVRTRRAYLAGPGGSEREANAR
jgi:Ca-activated chloride channel homolog